MKQSIKFAIILVASMAIAFFAGVFIERSQVHLGAASADVSRVRVYTKSVVEVDVDIFQERLLSDSAYFSSIANEALLMQNQAHTLDSLIEKTNETVGDNPSYATSVETINEAYKSVQNACYNLDLYVSSLSALADGKKVRNFEMIYNNALLSYYLVSKKVAFSEIFNADAAKELESGLGNLADVIELRCGWLAFAIGDMMMNGEYAQAREIIAESDAQGLIVMENLEMAALLKQDLKCVFPNLYKDPLQVVVLNKELHSIPSPYVDNSEQFGQRGVPNREQLHLTWAH